MFIVIESIDGGGKGRQRIEVENFLEQKGIKVKSKEFPDHENVIWENYIHPALHGKTSMVAGAWFSAFAFEKFIWEEELKKYKGDQNNLFIADGYYTSTLVYQCILQELPSLDFGIKFAEELKLVKPDLTIFLDVNPKVALHRKNNEEGKEEKDQFEGDIEKQVLIRDGFKKLADEQIWCKWVQIDGNGSIEEVRDAIIEEIRKTGINI